jgi:hypothetical protein
VLPVPASVAAWALMMVAGRMRRGPETDASRIRKITVAPAGEFVALPDAVDVNVPAALAVPDVIWCSVITRLMSLPFVDPMSARSVWVPTVKPLAENPCALKVYAFVFMHVPTITQSALVIPGFAPIVTEYEVDPPVFCDPLAHATSHDPVAFAYCKTCAANTLVPETLMLTVVPPSVPSAIL